MYLIYCYQVWFLTFGQISLEKRSHCGSTRSGISQKLEWISAVPWLCLCNIDQRRRFFSVCVSGDSRHCQGSSDQFGVLFWGMAWCRWDGTLGYLLRKSHPLETNRAYIGLDPIGGARRRGEVASRAIVGAYGDRECRYQPVVTY